MKMWIDPPSGWKYGFPKIWNGEGSIEDFLRENGLPEELIKLGHVRIWEKPTNDLLHK